MRPLLKDFADPASVRAFRRSLNLTQTEFWAGLGVPQSCGCRYETGRTIPKPVQLLLKLAYGTDYEARTTLHALRHRRERAINGEHQVVAGFACN